MSDPPDGEGSRLRRGQASSASIRAGPSGNNYCNLKWGRETSWLPREVNDVSHPMQTPLQPATGTIGPGRVPHTRSAEPTHPTSQYQGLQGKIEASQPEASSAPSPGAAYTEVLYGGPTAQPVSPAGVSRARSPSKVVSQRKFMSAWAQVPEQVTSTVECDGRTQFDTACKQMRPPGAHSKQPGSVPYNQRAQLTANATPSTANVKGTCPATCNTFRGLPPQQQRGNDYYTSQDEPGIALQSQVSTNPFRHTREQNAHPRRHNRKEARESFHTEPFATDNGASLSRRARKRLRAKERRQERQDANSTKSARSPLSAYVSDPKRYRHSREQRLQLRSTRTAATDQNASTFNATAHAHSPEPHRQMVPIRGVSNMGSGTPTGGSGWRKPEGGRHSQFRKHNTYATGKNLGGSHSAHREEHANPKVVPHHRGSNSSPPSLSVLYGIE